MTTRPKAVVVNVIVLFAAAALISFFLTGYL
jgi:hypothetical protein